MNILTAIILGCVEGITEFLPISSTGHLILTTDLLHISQTEFVKSFAIIIQSGAILAVIFLYWSYLLKKKHMIPKIIAGFIPTGIIGIIAYPVVKSYLLQSSLIVLSTLFLGGVILIIFEVWFEKAKTHNKNVDGVTHLSYKKAFVIGVFQAISIIPGASRALTTILGGMVVGLSRKDAVEFSFLLAIPTLLAATGLDLLETSFTFNSYEWLLLAIGFMTSFIVAIIVIKWFISFIQHHSFIPFGIYRIIIAILLFFVFFLS